MGSDEDNTRPHPKRPEFLPVPDSDIKLFDGNIVMFDTHPCVKWVTHLGFYKYEGKQYNGWYFTSVPDQELMPVHIADLRTVHKISNTMNGPKRKRRIHPKPVPPPFPPGPDVTIFTVDDKDHLDRAWLTLDTIAQRDALDKIGLKDGKIVRVNDVNGEVRFFQWSAENDHWEDFNIATKEDIEDCKVVWTVID